MNDTLDYFRTAPEYRVGDYHKLTFSWPIIMTSGISCHCPTMRWYTGKPTILQKMYGDYEMKFLQARAFYMYMYAHPGKKLNFMGK